MQVFSKLPLSFSSNGKQILISSTGSAITTSLHTSTAALPTGSATISIDEIYIYASNNSTSSLTCSLLWGGSDPVADACSFVLPAQNSRTLLADGKLLGANLVVGAYAQVPNVIVVDGFVNRISDSSIDTYVNWWAQRVIVNGGSMPSYQTMVAMTTFYRGLVNTGLFSKMISVNCIVPDSLIAAATPFILRDGKDPWTNHNFVSSDLTVNGLKGDGSSKYLDMDVNLGHIPTLISSSNAGLTVYNYDAFNSSSTSGYALGVGGAANSAQFALYQDNTGNIQVYIWRFVNVGTDSLTPPSPVFGGYLSGNRTGNARIDAYFANSFTTHSVLSSGTGTQTGALISDFNMVAFAINAVGSITGYSNERMSFLAVHSGLSAADSLNFFNLIQSLRINLGGGYV